MMKRMNQYNTLQTKMTIKLNDLKNLTSHELYEPEVCNEYCEKQYCIKSLFLCPTMLAFNKRGWDTVTDVNQIILLIDLVTLEAIDLGKREDTLEMVLQVT